MGAGVRRVTDRGPFNAEQIRAGDPYELSNGHPIYCLPTGGRGGAAALAAGAALASDPAVTSAGVDVGFSPEPGTLRAPDIAIGHAPNAVGWVRGVPPLAVEYADTGQNEDELQQKIRDLLTAGTQLIWVVRLVGPRRVEIYEQGAAAPRVVNEDAELSAPGILMNKVPVAAMFDPGAAQRLTLRNLLQRQGVKDINAIREEARKEGHLEGRAEAILDILAARGVAVDNATSATIRACTDIQTLRRWLACAAIAEEASDIVALR